MEKKKRGKGIIITIVILALVAGGWFVYNSLIKSDALGTVEVVEVKEIASVDGDYDNRDNEAHKKIFNVLKDNDAIYYKIENSRNTLNIIQINKEDFDSISPINGQKCVKSLEKGLLTLFNSRYDHLPKTMYSINDYSYTTIFGKLIPSDSDEATKKWVEEAFGEELEKMFKEHKIKLSCDRIKIEKMAVYDTEQASIVNAGGADISTNCYEYYFVVDANVKTESANTKISEFSVFADEGESKDIRLLMHCNAEDFTKSLGILEIFI